MISQRELERIKHEMDDLVYYSVETDILRELIETYERSAPVKPARVIPPPERKRQHDD